ncbi:unnamed protein product [Timema podura]|uniref:Odorant receptor n=1 Tax=Timema podura TaxID=61482 RepID=A0ABN7NM77_TIMPD|nr:unnamed protein product [Timema podura]
MRHVTTSNKSWSDYIKKLLTALLFVNAIIIMTSEVINLAIVTKNLEQVTAAIAVLSLHVQGLSKWLNMVINRQQLSEIIRLFDECFQVGTGCEKLNETRAKERVTEPYEDKTSESSRSSAMFSGCHLRSKILTLLWVLLCIQGELNWILIPIFNCLTRVNEGVTDVAPESCRVLPLPGWHPVDTSSSPCYEILYLMQVLCNTTTVLAMVVFDVFALSLMMFTCGHFRCLKMYLKHIVVDERDMLENGNLDVGFTYGNGQYLDSLDELVSQNHAHDESGEFINEMNRLFSPVMFVQCLLNLMIVCLSAFEATTRILPPPGKLAFHTLARDRLIAGDGKV